MKQRLRTSRGKNKDRKNFDQALVDGGKCGRPTRNPEAKGPYCTLDAGWGTDHVGAGACRKHGGNTPIKHGYDSGIIRARLGDSYEQFKNDPNIATVDSEVALLRGLVQKAIEAGKEGEDVATLAEKVVRAVETMGKIRQKFGITVETLNRMTEQMGVAVSRHVKDPAILAAIERDWSEIRLA